MERPRIRTILMLLIAALAFSAGHGLAAQTDPHASKITAVHDPELSNFQAVEFRRYTIKPGEREHFVRYFDTWFPEAFQQVGAIAAGSFQERSNDTGFTWIRGFHTIDDRAVANAAFYYGSVWNEHRDAVNALIADSDNVLLLRPLNPDQGLLVLPAVDPVTEQKGAQGVIVAEVFAVKKGEVEEFGTEAEPVFAQYRAAGAREAGILVTLDVGNNFPQLPIRTDGPYLVWLGILRDNQALNGQFTPVARQATEGFQASEHLRAAPELIVLDPTPRSRMRWLPAWK